MTGLPDANDTDDVTAARIQLLDILSLMEVSVGDSKALESAREENARADRLEAKDASNPKWLRLWVMARGELSDVLLWQCDCADAIVQASSSIESAKTLLAASPNDDFLHERLLTDYETIGDSSRALGDIDQADKAYTASLADIDAAVARQPGEPRWLADRAFAVERVGDLLLLRDKPAEAAAQYQTYNAIAKQLVAQHPQDANYLAALAQSLQRLGDSWLAQDDGARALSAYRQYLEAATTLSNDDPSNLRFRDFFATAHQRLADVRLRDKDYAGASQELAVYLSMTQDMRTKDPSNNLALYDVSNAFGKIGDVRRESGDLAGALDAYRQSQTLALELAAKHCQNGTWQKAVAMSYRRIGTILEAQGDASGALAQFRQCASAPAKPLVWSPASVLPRDAAAACRDDVRRLSGAP